MSQELDQLRQDVTDIVSEVAAVVKALDDLAVSVANGQAVSPADLTALSAMLKPATQAMKDAVVRDDPAPVVVDPVPPVVAA